MKMSDLYGAVSKCNRCSNSNPATPMPCTLCFCRGFVAECLHCSGKGMITEPVVGGANGTMSVTCPSCGGARCFAVNKPANWDELNPAEPVEVSVESAPVAETSSTAVYAETKDIPAGQKNWVTPAPRPGAHVTSVAASA
jgi:hypothetical protein